MRYLYEFNGRHFLLAASRNKHLDGTGLIFLADVLFVGPAKAPVRGSRARLMVAIVPTFGALNNAQLNLNCLALEKNTVDFSSARMGRLKNWIAFFGKNNGKSGGEEEEEKEEEYRNKYPSWKWFDMALINLFDLLSCNYLIILFWYAIKYGRRHSFVWLFDSKMPRSFHATFTV